MGNRDILFENALNHFSAHFVGGRDIGKTYVLKGFVVSAEIPDICARHVLKTFQERLELCNHFSLLQTPGHSLPYHLLRHSMYPGLLKTEDKSGVDRGQLMEDKGQGIVHFSKGKLLRPATMQYLKFTCPKLLRLVTMLFHIHKFKK